METISTTDMTEYLKQVMEMEVSVYQQEEAIKEARKCLVLRKPKKEEVSEPTDKSISITIPKKPILNLTKKDSQALAFGLIFGPIFVGLGIFWLALEISAIIAIAMILFGVLLISVSIDIKKSNKQKLEFYKSSVKKYEEDIKNYEETIEETKKEYSSAMETYKKKKAEIEEQYNKDCVIAQKNYDVAYTAILQLDAPLAESKETLEKLYAVGWIFPKYRNMIAICTIYEYFASGRVATLEGPDGAYNLYEAELRQNIIINRLDTIIKELEEIKQSQYMVYMAISRTNQMLSGIGDDIKSIVNMTEGICDSTKSIALTSHITACCSQSIEKNTAALKTLVLHG